MKPIEKIREWCVVAVLVASFFALTAAGGLFISAQIALRHVDGFLTSRSVEGLPMTVRHANQILKEAGETLVVVKKASVAQETYWDANTKKIGIVLDQANTDLVKFGYATDQLDGLLAWTNRQMNGDLLPALTEQVKSIAVLSSALEQDAKQLQIAIGDAEHAINNPDIPSTLAQVKGTTENLNKTTGDIYELVDNYKRKAEQPKSFLWRVFSALTGVGAKAGQISILAK